MSSSSLVCWFLQTSSCTKWSLSQSGKPSLLRPTLKSPRGFQFSLNTGPPSLPLSPCWDCQKESNYHALILSSGYYLLQFAKCQRLYSNNGVVSSTCFPLLLAWLASGTSVSKQGLISKFVEPVAISVRKFNFHAFQKSPKELTKYQYFFCRRGKPVPVKDHIPWSSHESRHVYHCTYMWGFGQFF